VRYLGSFDWSAIRWDRMLCLRDLNASQSEIGRQSVTRRRVAFVRFCATLFACRRYRIARSSSICVPRVKTKLYQLFNRRTMQMMEAGSSSQSGVGKDGQRSPGYFCPRCASPIYDFVRPGLLYHKVLRLPLAKRESRIWIQRESRR
jgi:hypothetical protein